jgi:uncharacterized membrane protein/mono/diheme cytochrome c family protein
MLTIFGFLTAALLAVIPGFLPEVPANPDLMRFLGRFHPLILHLPIGVMTLVFLQEIVLLFSKRDAPASALTVGFASATAVAAALTGILLVAADPAEFRGRELVQDHLLGGIAFAVSTIVLLVVHAWTEARLGKRHLFRFTLLVSVSCMISASHDGASITHGSNYLTQSAPNWLRSWLGMPLASSPKQPAHPASPATPPAPATIYRSLIQPIFDQRCVQCHKEGKAKGKLRMDRFDELMKGGFEGPAVIPGNAAASRIVERMVLPEDDDLHMPPAGKPDVTPKQLAVIQWWIDEGASETSTLGESALPGELIENPAK